MTYRDYLDCAMQYREQADRIERAIIEKSRPMRFATAFDRSENERTVKGLYLIKLECLKTMAGLEKRGREIMERERRENKNSIA